MELRIHRRANRRPFNQGVYQETQPSNPPLPLVNVIVLSTVDLAFLTGISQRGQGFFIACRQSDAFAVELRISGRIQGATHGKWGVALTPNSVRTPCHHGVSRVLSCATTILSICFLQRRWLGASALQRYRSHSNVRGCLLIPEVQPASFVNAYDITSLHRPDVDHKSIRGQHQVQTPLAPAFTAHS